jgi:hypothetical protein
MEQSKLVIENDGKHKVALESHSIAHTKQVIDQKIKEADKQVTNNASPAMTPLIKPNRTNIPITGQSATNMPKNVSVNQSAVSISNSVSKISSTSKQDIPPVETTSEMKVSSYVVLSKTSHLFQKMR